MVFSFQFSVFSCGGVGEVFAVRGFIFAEGVLSSLLDSREAAKPRRETLGGVEGVLPPHPRPLSPCGGEGGILVFSFQFSVFSCGGVGEVFAVRGFIFAAGVLSSLLDSREAAKLRRETLGGVEGVLPPHPRPLSPCGGEGGILVFSFRFSVVGESAKSLRCGVSYLLRVC